MPIRVFVKSNTTITNYFTTFYKMLMWPTSYWFSSMPIINITFSFTNNYLPHQQLVKNFVQLFVSLALFNLLMNHLRKVLMGKEKKAINILVVFSISHKSYVKIFLNTLLTITLRAPLTWLINYYKSNLNLLYFAWE